MESLLQVVPADYLQLCDADRVSNPHGEHAHEAFRIEVQIPEGVWGAIDGQNNGLENNI